MILKTYQRGIHFFASLVDTDAPAVGAPPQTLWPFMKWCVRGAWHVMILAAIMSVFASITEVTTIFLLGRVVDAVSVPGAELGDFIPLAILVSFLLLVARPG